MALQLLLLDALFQLAAQARQLPEHMTRPNRQTPRRLLTAITLWLLQHCLAEASATAIT